MIKGCSKKVIVVKDTGSSIFEEAYFIVNPKETERKYSDFLSEANRIIASKTVKTAGNVKRNLRSLVALTIGFVLGAATAAPVIYFIF